MIPDGSNVLDPRANSGHVRVRFMPDHTELMETSETGWFAVRCVFEISPSDPTGGQAATYEERVTLWQAQNFDEAIAHAEDDADDYAETIGARFLGLSQAYHLADTPGHGAEVFSLMRDSQLGPPGYVKSFFATGDERQSVSARSAALSG